jgi:hypothetical protein
VAHASDVGTGDALAVRFHDGRVRVHVDDGEAIS